MNLRGYFIGIYIGALSIAVSETAVAKTSLGTPDPMKYKEALAAYTAGVAYQAFSDGGALVVGAPADFAVLDRDPRAVEPHDLSTIRIRAAYIAGRRRS